MKFLIFFTFFLITNMAFSEFFKDISLTRCPPPQPMSIMVCPYCKFNSFNNACLLNTPILVDVSFC